jgi:hypothetical protein
VARSTKSERIMAEIWAAVRHMIEPELNRYRRQYPGSRRRAILEAMQAAAENQDEGALAVSGMEYFRLTRTVPPGCYAVCQTRQPSHYLSGERVTRRRGEAWTIWRFSPQVWR